MNLLDQFLSQDCDKSARVLLLGLIEKKEDFNGTKQMSFNRFDIHLCFGDRSVMIEDDLDTSPAGRLFVPMSEFAEALELHQV